MSMQHITVDEQIEQHEWETFLLQNSTPPFLQSWHMRSLHELLGEKTFPIAIRVNDTLVGIAMCIFVRARRGTYLYIPYGPVFTKEYWSCFAEFSTYIRKRGKELGADFVRSSPFIANTDETTAVYTQAGWKPAPIHMLAEHVWWLNISPSEEDIMAGMRKTMRNSIRRAQKDGVQIRLSTDVSDVEHLIHVHRDTVQKHGFVPYSDAYFRAEFAAFVEEKQAVLFLAEYQERVIAAAMIVFYGDMASYHHSGALLEYRKIPSSYLIQWEAIREAKKRGCTTYNFWGIAPPDKLESPLLKRQHPFAGVTTFKTGFGGSQFDLLHCQDLPITPKYTLTRAIETARRIKRGFY